MKKVSLIILSLLLTACAANHASVPTIIPNATKLTEQAEGLLQDTPAIVRVAMPNKAFVLDLPALGIPEHLDKKLPHVAFFDTDIQTIIYSIAHQQTKMNFIYEAPRNAEVTQKTKRSFDRALTGVGVTANSSTTDQIVGKNDRMKRISVSYQGKLSGFLRVLANSSGYFFTYDQASGSIIVKETETFNFVIPNYTSYQKEKSSGGKNFTLQEEIESSLQNLGATDISYDTFSSSLSFTSDANGFKRVKAYLKSLKDNAALVTMQVLLLEVNLTNNKNRGIDWSKLVLGYGSQKQSPFGVAASNMAAATTTTDSSSAVVGAIVDPMAKGLAAVFTGTGAEMFVEAKNFSLGMLFNFLEQYGHYSIAQNIRIESMSGTKGKFKVLTETPYVSEVQFTALSQQSSTATAGFKSAVAKSGVEIEVVPYYNKAEGSLSMALTVNVSGVTQMVTLQAGQQLGTITQPETTIKSLEDFLRMSPGHIAIIGGLTYEKLNNHSAGLPGESLLSKTYQTSVTKNELVLVVKPTIYEFY
jgi:type II secretory pathway component GspD/PulD (secretin)